MKYVLDNNVLAPLLIIGSALLAGLMFERIILRKIIKVSRKTKWIGDDIIFSAMRGLTSVWILLLGLYLAPLTISFSQSWLVIIRKIIVLALVVSGAVFIMRVAIGFIRHYSKSAGGTLPSTSLLTNLARIIIVILGILIMLETVGISITPLITALGIGGLAVALALQDTLANIFAGIQILASRQIKIGDYVKLPSGEQGYIADINWRNTAIRDLSNNTVIIPNAKLSNSILTNYYLPDKETVVLVQVGVSYNSDLAKVEQITNTVAREIMQEVSGGVSTFSPFIRFHTFGDSAVNFTVILKGQEFVDQYLLKHEFIKRLHKRFQEEGIEIPFPIRKVYLTQEEESQ